MYLQALALQGLVPFRDKTSSDPQRYDYDESLLPDARNWNLARYWQTLASGQTPIIVDRGNGLNAESREYALLADQQGYHIKLREPDSPWWQELRVLLKYREFVDETLFDQWAEQLSAKSATGHRVPAATIRRWMKHWRHDVTVDAILSLTD